MEAKTTRHMTKAAGDSVVSAEKDTQARWQTETLIYRILISAIFIFLIILHLFFPDLKIDSITLAMAVVAMLPWFGRLIESFEAPGGWKFRFREFREEVKDNIRSINREIDYIKFIFTNFLTKWEVDHLNNLLKDQFIFTRSEAFDQELRRLRAIGFIEPAGPDKGIRSMNADHSRDVKNHFRITDRGKMYLKLLEDMERNLTQDD